MKKQDWIKEAMAKMEQHAKEAAHFQKHEYPNLSREDKIAYWASGWRQQFRWNEESGVDGYAIFSLEDYLFWKTIEPDLESLLPDIANLMKISLDKMKNALNS